MQARRIPAAAEDASTVLCAPQAWPHLGRHRFRVDFVRRDGTAASYRVVDADDTVEATIDVAGSGWSAVLHICSPDEKRSRTQTPALSWHILELDDHTCELRWELPDELPAPLDICWEAVTNSQEIIAEWADELDRLRVAVDPVAAATALGPMLRTRATHSAAAGTLDPGTVSAIRAGGLFRLGAPALLGGTATDPRTIIDTIAELSRADAAAGWCTFIGNQTAYAAWLPHDGLAELAGTADDVILAGPPLSQVTPSQSGMTYTW